MSKILTIETEIENLKLFNLRKAGFYAQIDVEADLLFAAIDYEIAREHYEKRIEREVYEALSEAGVTKLSFSEWMKEKQKKEREETLSKIAEIQTNFRRLKDGSAN